MLGHLHIMQLLLLLMRLLLLLMMLMMLMLLLLMLVVVVLHMINIVVLQRWRCLCKGDLSRPCMCVILWRHRVVGSMGMRCVVDIVGSSILQQQYP